jgi:hypothetical protein
VVTPHRNIFWPGRNWGLLLTSALLLASAVGIFIELINGRLWMSDLEVYLKAAQRFVEARPLYLPEEDGFYRYKYGPSAAIFFLPLVYFPSVIAKLLFWVVLTVTFLALNTLMKLKQHWTLAALVAAGIAVAPHFARELHLGQVNLLLMAWFVVAGLLANQGQDRAAGVILGASVVIKPYALIFIPLVLVQRRVRLAIVMAMTALLVSFVPVYLVYPPAAAQDLLVSWAKEIAIELTGKSDLLTSNNQTLASAFAKALRETTGFFLPKTASLISLGSITICLYAHVKRLERSINFSTWTSLMIAIPLLAATDANAFIFAWPALCLGFSRWRDLDKTSAIFLAVGAIFLGVNIYDLLGRELSQQLGATSICAWGGFFCLATAARYTQ